MHFGAKFHAVKDREVKMLYGVKIR